MADHDQQQPDIRGTVARLAQLDPIDYLQQRDDAAKTLGITAAELTALIKAARRNLKEKEAEADRQAKDNRRQCKVTPEEKAEILDTLARLDRIAYAQEREGKAALFGIGIGDLDIAVEEIRKKIAEDKAGPSPIDLAATVARLAVLDKSIYDTQRKAEADRLRIRVGTLDTAVERARAALRLEEEGLRAEWLKNAQRTDDGYLCANLANAMLALTEDPELHDLIALDLMQHEAVLMRPLPGGTAGEFPKPIDDIDVIALQQWLQLAGLNNISTDTVHHAVDLRARQRAFHPVRDYLTSLKWDGTPRVATWTSYYLGAENTAYNKAIGQMFLISMVARVYQPGCKADYMLILEEQQGVGKSMVCSTLAGEWFDDSMPDLHHGDAVRLSMQMRGKWLIEVAEMWAMSRAEAGRLKAFVTQTTERFVPKFGHKGVKEPRQCVFMGTTNKKVYLRDETGGRRFWPLACSTIDQVALQRDRDQIFAEATVLYQQGKQWWPDAEFERQHIQPQQEARYEADPWEDAINEYLEGKSTTSVLKVAKHALAFDTSRLGPPDRNRITAALERAGWERGTRTKEGVPWFPKDPAQPNEAAEQPEPDEADARQAEPAPAPEPSAPPPDDLNTAGAKLVIALFRKAHQHFRDRERANLWMTTRHPALGMQKPEHVCQEPGGTTRCMDILKSTK